jgi:hypothetical protein
VQPAERRGLFPADVASARSHRPTRLTNAVIAVAMVAFIAGFALCLVLVAVAQWATAR